jgi:hypothetical protein|tara:strand:+ start:378 stop:584 length:207 start_codon:yes stop_codon:yes gene_type:complete
MIRYIVQKGTMTNSSAQQPKSVGSTSVQITVKTGRYMRFYFLAYMLHHSNSEYGKKYSIKGDHQQEAT